MFFHLSLAMAIILIGQFVCLAIIDGTGGEIVEKYHESNWFFSFGPNARIMTFFIYQPFLVVGLTLIYAFSRILRIWGYNRIYFTIIGGILHFVFMVFLAVFFIFNAHLELHLSIFIVSCILAVSYGAFIFPIFLKESVYPDSQLSSDQHIEEAEK